MTFAQEIKKWRATRCQKQVNDIFGVSLACYRAWEQGQNEPSKLAQEQIRYRMILSDAGLSPERIRIGYLQVIKQVAAEIQNRK
jgi:DNA-binding transcriptional regulator YiaG